MDSVLNHFKFSLLHNLTHSIRIDFNINLPSTSVPTNCPLPKDFQSKMVYAFPIVPIRSTYLAHLMLFDFITLITVDGEYKL